MPHFPKETAERLVRRGLRLYQQQRCTVQPKLLCSYILLLVWRLRLRFCYMAENAIWEGSRHRQRLLLRLALFPSIPLPDVTGKNICYLSMLTETNTRCCCLLLQRYGKMENWAFFSKYGLRLHGNISGSHSLKVEARYLKMGRVSIVGSVVLNDIWATKAF